MARASSRLRVKVPHQSREDFRDRSGDRSQKQISEPVRPSVETVSAAPPEPLVISIEATERLRQMLRTETLASESDLIALVKDRLAMQYMRGVNEGAGQGGNNPDRIPSGSTKKMGRSDSWEMHRRAQQKSRLKNVLATVMVLLMVGTAIVVATMFSPTLSGDAVRVTATDR
jgi:hypothetical protein